MIEAQTFLKDTEEFVFQGANPGGHYTAIWCRDASYILNDWFISGGNIIKILELIGFIWSHQIKSGNEKLIYGRGSPDMNFRISTANNEIERVFEGALPTTIYSRYNFSEVYGKLPDIDSTALMVSCTSFILHSLLRQDDLALSTAHKHSKANIEPDEKLEIIDQLVPKMTRAIECLKSHDIDGDYLLEQGYNEDWMDTTLRAGKIVYSQAAWILALKNFTALLFELDNKRAEAKKTLKLAQETIDAVDRKLWSHRKNCYVDFTQRENYADFGIITQDVLAYLLAISKNKRPKDNRNSSDNNNNTDNNLIVKSNIQCRSIETLDTLRKIWKGGWPLVTESVLAKTGPAILKPNEYHNYTCWPWMTAIEMLSRNRFDRLEEQDLVLLSELISKANGYAFYEWIDLSTESGHGAFPFRTGVSSMRLALREIIMGLKMQANIGHAITTDNVTNSF